MGKDLRRKEEMMEPLETCVTIIYAFGGSAASRLESVSVCFHFFARDSLLKEFGTTNIMLKV